MGKWKIYQVFPPVFGTGATSSFPMWVLQTPGGFRWYYWNWSKAVKWLVYHLQKEAA